MVNFGIQAADIVSLVWGTPGNFNGFRVLAALLHGISSGRQPNFAALNRRRHLRSAGRLSRWALAHILVYSTLECGPMPNLMVAMPNVGGAFCSTPQSLADAHY